MEESARTFGVAWWTVLDAGVCAGEPPAASPHPAPALNRLTALGSSLAPGWAPPRRKAPHTDGAGNRRPCPRVGRSRPAGLGRRPSLECGGPSGSGPLAERPVGARDPVRQGLSARLRPGRGEPARGSADCPVAEVWEAVCSCRGCGPGRWGDGRVGEGGSVPLSISPGLPGECHPREARVCRISLFPQDFEILPPLPSSWGACILLY